MFSGGDLHYHLSQHGVFSEKEMRFYAAEIILGLEHMHNRFVVYRDLKVNNSHEKYHMNASADNFCVCILSSVVQNLLKTHQQATGLGSVITMSTHCSLL